MAATIPLLVSNGLNGAPVALHKTSRPQSQIGVGIGGNVNNWAASQSAHAKNSAAAAHSAYGGFKNINANAGTMTGMLISGS